LKSGKKGGDETSPDIWNRQAERPKLLFNSRF
jgi:hypothetical protein